MEFKQLQSFTALVQFKSFTKAAEYLGISQPTISTHIRLLEEELESKLILRTTKSVEISNRGWELYECACKILDLRDSLLRSWSGDGKRILQLGVSTIPSSYILPEILPAFGKHNPDHYFSIHQDDSEGIVKKMLAGEYDIGLVGLEIDQDEIDCIPFYSDRMILITPVDEKFIDLKKNGEAVDILTMGTEPFILREQGSGSRKSVERYLEIHGINEEDLHIVARVNDQESIKNLVAQGMGISIISEKAADNFIKERRILGFDLGDEAASRNLYCIVRKGDTERKSIQDFITFLVNYYKEPRQ